MMNKGIAVLPLVVATLALSITSIPAFAGKHAKPEKMTCEEFLMLDEEVQPSIIYWLQGKSGEIDEIDIDEHRRPVSYVVTECYKEKQATVWEKTKQYFENIKKNMKPAEDDNN